MADRAPHEKQGVHNTAQPVNVQQDGVWVGTKRRLNFVGATVTSDDDTGTVTVTMSGAGWSPLGIGGLAYGSGSDATISVNASIANQVQVYRDLTINAGIVLTCGFSPQIIIARTISFADTAAQISANGLGGATIAEAVGAAGPGGNGGVTTTTLSTALAAESNPYDLLERYCANGGQGNDNATNGAAGSAYNPALLAQIITGSLPLLGLAGGGGGGAHGSGATAGGTGPAGRRGGAGKVGSTSATGGGGGSGVGGGGGAGGGTNSGGGSGGAGGGVVMIFCETIQTAAGLVTANGANGSAGSGVNSGGGGGGGGGLVLIYVKTATTVPTLQANGGSGGAKTGSGKAGGAGGAGITQLLRNA